MKHYPESYSPIREYWQAIESGRETAGLKVRQVYEHLNRKLDHRDGEFWYSPKRANHILEFAENFCRHSKGKYGGQLVKLELWEKALLAAAFGFVDQDGLRQYREVLLIVGK